MADDLLKILLAGSFGGVSAGAILFVLMKHLVERIIPNSDTFKRQVALEIKNDPTIKAIHDELKALKDMDHEIKAFYMERLSVQIEQHTKYQQQTSERLARLEEKYDSQGKQLDRIEIKMDSRNEKN